MLIAGVDEAGRGPLAGPVVAAAVVLPAQHAIMGLNDSKKLTANKRAYLYDEIYAKATAVSIAKASVAEIDALNILQAALLAMKRALQTLTVTIDKALIDGNKVPTGLMMPAEAIIKGDSQFECIMAASIVAKVWRDRHMLNLDQQYPNYGLARHAGYPTKQHLQALSQYGVTPIHRKTFKPVKQILDACAGVM